MDFWRRDVSVRERLPGDVRRILYIGAWGVAAIGLVQEWVVFSALKGIGGDSHAYWSALHGPMYTSGPGTLNAYLYSPVFAQVLWPAAQLPWKVFVAAFSVGDALLLTWLLRPLGWWWIVPLLLAASPEICAGNIFIPMAVAAVMGFRYPATWSLSALTKITPTLGPVWWLVRHEWNPLVISVTVTLAISAPSMIATPHLWVQWFDFLRHHLAATRHTLGAPTLPPLIYRLPVGCGLVAWGAWRNHRWTIPVAMLLATPNLWLGSYTLLAAIPRLRADQDRTVHAVSVDAQDLNRKARGITLPPG